MSLGPVDGRGVAILLDPEDGLNEGHGRRDLNPGAVLPDDLNHGQKNQL